jgi:ssRNA-specific RNase YbeY (16S rRNA maturation enzyme)
MHGMLHLVGYDHNDQEEEEAMTFMQRKIFNELGIRDDKVI